MDLDYIFPILELIVTSHFFLLGIYLFFEKNRRNDGVRYLGLLFFLIGFHYLFNSLGQQAYSQSNYIIKSYFSLKLWSFLLYSFGPVLLLATQAYVIEDFKLKRIHLLHLLGYVFPIFHYLNPHLLADTTMNDWTYLGIGAELHNLSYGVVALIITKRLKNEELKNHKKLFYQLNITYIIITLSWIIFEFARFQGWESNDVIKAFFLILLTYLVDGTIIMCWRYPDTIINSKYIRSRLKGWVSEKYQDSKVEENYAEKILDALTKHVEQTKLYTSTELKISVVSEKIGFPAKDISQVVNVYMSKSFNEYLNSLRIAEATRLLLERQDLNIMEVMYKTGFNSKSLFFKYFKEEHGMTPFQFKKRTSSNDNLNTDKTMLYVSKSMHQ
ncbi:helix-turn-helix domain-containing protein [Ekhidna sp. To15]|uniref:AraC family transcriptional regulator n=1 Tax=Ekhidna sp. To15 TaxID=3395267 RepID=UPI003F52156F